MMKPGYKTSEFWFTLVSFIFSGLYLTGLMSENGHKEELITTVSHAVESVILISGQCFIFYKYIKGRSEVKRIVETKQVKNLDVDNTETAESSQTKTIRKKKNASKRTNISSSRNNNSANKRVSKKSKKNSSK